LRWSSIVLVNLNETGIVSTAIIFHEFLHVLYESDDQLFAKTLTGLETSEIDEASNAFHAWIQENCF
jgi:hypothetical protein